MYPADGRKVPDVYTTPPGLRDELQSKLGTFPLFEFWGPRASIRSTQWIAESAKEVDRRFNPTLTLVYLPHLDYNLQRVGPGDPAAAADLTQVDAVCGDLIRHYESHGAQVIVLSEYGLRDVSSPIHLNRVLREHGLLAVRDELGHETIDPGASAAFAVADHQVAHVYVNDPAKAHEVRALIEKTRGVEAVLDQAGKRAHHIDHPRAGDLIAVSEPNVLVYLLLLAGRSAGARLRADGGHPSQARLRPGGVVRRSGDSDPGPHGGMEAGETQGGAALPARRDSARRVARERIARAPDRLG